MQNPELRSELLDLVAVDQKLRHKVIHNMDDQELRAQIREVDQKNTARLREIVAEYGWPGNSRIGVDGVNAAWLIIQHADHSLDFQKECLELMTVASPDEVSREHVAYLTDRVRMNSGQQQLYGCGFHWDEHGNFGPLPIEDPDHVDERRAQMGMNSLQEHWDYMKRTYDDVLKAAKKPET